MAGSESIMDWIKRKVFILSGMNAARRASNRHPHVLFWHGVGTAVDPVVCPEVFGESAFVKQVRYLKRHYEVIAVEELERRLTENRLTGREVVLTFDDGYANNLNVVAPILTGLGLPFTVFVSTDNITTGDFYPTTVNRLVTIAAGLDLLDMPSLGKKFTMATDSDRIAAAKEISVQMKSRPVDEVQAMVADLIGNLPAGRWEEIRQRYSHLRPMNWDEVRQLAAMDGVTIGSHCMWHICCHDRQRQEEVHGQIVKSKQVIEERLQRPCDFFAYPNGSFTAFSSGCVGDTYKLGFSAETKTSVSLQDRNVLPRIAAYIDLDLFKILLSSI